MSQEQGNDMRLDDSEAKSRSGTSPSNGGGSQDSIDSAAKNDLCHYLVELENAFMVDPSVNQTEPHWNAFNQILAWHNTQLKSVLQSLRELSTQEFVHSESSAAFDEGRSYEQWRISRAIDDMERNINAAS